MAVNLSPVGGVAAQFFTNTGAVLTGGKIYTYTAGTTTPAVTFTSNSGATPHPNPIVLDAAGRVSGGGEIWITDGILYKFLLKDANDVLIATYDNISGINSNFVSFVNQQEIQTATANQTLFTLATVVYQPGTGSLSVFVDGVNQYGPGAQYAFIETSSTSVTFVSGLHVGASVKFTTSQFNSSSYGDASQITYYDTFNASNTNVQTALQEHLRGNTGKQHFAIGAIPRCTAGVFSLLDDANHTPLNISSVTQPTAFDIRVNYAKTATKINSFVVGPDDALAPYGVVCGGDVGTSFANIITAAPFSAKISLTGGVPSLAMNDLWAGAIAGGNIAVSTSNASIVRITHVPAVTNDPPVCSYNSATVPGLYPVISFFNDSTIDVMMTGDAAGFVEYNGTAWVQSASQNLTAPTMTWTGGNRLRIDHGISNTTNRVPLVVGHKGVYLPQIYDIGTTWFEVEFYDYAGTKVTTQNTNMKIWYRREMPVPCVWSDTMDVVVRRGLLKVPSALYSGVAGNNFWVTGTMEY